MARWLDPDRIARLRQKQEVSFTPIFLHRPAAILLLIPLADVAWITPNLLTVLNVVVRFVVAGILWPEAWGGLAEGAWKVWVAVILWNLGGTLDAADGTLARYRGQSTVFGRYLDKVTDRFVTLSLVCALAARAWAETGRPVFVFLGMVYVALMSAASVAKWIEYGLKSEVTGRTEKVSDPDERGAPKRTFLGWVSYLVASLRYLPVITEMDLPFWGSLALIFGRLDLFFWLLGILGAPFGVVMVVQRGWRLHRGKTRELPRGG